MIAVNSESLSRAAGISGTSIGKSLFVNAVTSVPFRTVRSRPRDKRNTGATGIYTAAPKAISTAIRIVCDCPLKSFRATSSTLWPVVSTTDPTLMIISPPIPNGRFRFTSITEPCANVPAGMAAAPFDLLPEI